MNISNIQQTQHKNITIYWDTEPTIYYVGDWSEDRIGVLLACLELG